VQINMTTFAGRRTQYVDRTLESLFKSDWSKTKGTLNLILESEDDSHVAAYANHPSVRIVPWDIETNPSLRLNCTLNKIRALRWGDAEEGLTCEDDIDFFSDWVERLELAKAELADEKYVLSLFAAKPQLAAAPALEGKTRVKRYPIEVPQGAQALYYPTKATRLKVANYLTANLRKGCGDDLIGRWANAHAALYATSTILVSHIGGTSCFH